MELDDKFYMSLALQEAWKYQLLTYPNPAVGALIVDQFGKIVSIQAHQSAGSEHAELKAVEAALNDKSLMQLSTPSQKHSYIIEHYQNYFSKCTIYITLEPCNHYGSTPPCSLLIEKMGFKRVVCGVKDPNNKASGGIERLRKRGIEVSENVLQKECENLIYPFRIWQEKKRLIFFKIATTLNGVYDGGLISSKASRELVHRYREKIDLLIIGGESVRVDRPTLDCRLVATKAPDILILSHHDDFDRSIPLFHVKDRKVYIEDNFDKIDDYKFIMVEGGDSLIQTLKNKIDLYLFFRSPNLKKGKTLQLDEDMEYLYSFNVDIDKLDWIKEKR